MLLNLILVFLTIFIANKTREIEKRNFDLDIEISRMNEDIKINHIELVAHNNNSYLRSLYFLYFSEIKKNNMPNVLTLNEFLNTNDNIKLVNINN